MFLNWDKVDSILHFAVETIALRHNVDSSFYLEWSRGDSKGQTDQIRPDASGILNFNAIFECPCTMYVSKRNQSVRPKIIKFLLYRNIDQNGKKFKVYGKLNVNVGVYYGLPNLTRDSVEMESGRSITPICTCSYVIRQVSKPTSSSILDQDDISFIGDNTSHIKYDDWDKTEIIDKSKKSKAKKKHHNEPTLTSSKNNQSRKNSLKARPKPVDDFESIQQPRKRRQTQEYSVKYDKLDLNKVKRHHHHAVKPFLDLDALDDSYLDIIEELRNAKERERIRKEEEEKERIRKEKEEKERIRKEEEEKERIRKEEEEERIRKEEEEKERIRKEEEERKRKEEEERKRKEEEEKERKRKEEEKKERKRKEEEEKERKRKEEEEKERKRKEEEEKERKQKEEDKKPPSKKDKYGFFAYTPTTKYSPRTSHNPNHVVFLVPIEPPVIIDYSDYDYYDYDDGLSLPPLKSQSSESFEYYSTSDEETPPKTQESSKSSSQLKEIESPLDLLKVVLDIKWVEEGNRIVGSIIMPTEAYPITCCIISSGILNENPSQSFFDTYCDTLFTKLSHFPFQKSVPLSLLFEALGKQSKCELFATKALEFRKKCVLNVFDPYLKNANVLINRIATAQFEQDSALMDLKNEILSHKNFDPHPKSNTFRLQKEINNALISAFRAEFDARLWVQIVRNPIRFCFGNSSKWNSLISAVESNYQLNFPLTREGIFTLCMLQNISRDPSLAKDIAPHLPPELLCYLMMNYRPDEMMPVTIDFFKFMQKNKIRSVDDGWTCDALPVSDFELLVQKIKVSDLFKKPYTIKDDRFSFMKNFKYP